MVVQTGHTIMANRLIADYTTEKKGCLLIDIAVADNVNIFFKETEKISNVEHKDQDGHGRSTRNYEYRLPEALSVNPGKAHPKWIRMIALSVPFIQFPRFVH